MSEKSEKMKSMKNLVVTEIGELKKDIGEMKKVASFFHQKYKKWNNTQDLDTKIKTVNK